MLPSEVYAAANHTHDEEIALDVVAGIPCFLEETIFLRDKLGERLA